MGGTSEFYCMVKNDLSDDVGREREPSAWTTFRWSDEFDNSIAPFFTSLEAGQPFLKEMTGWQLKRYPVTFVVAVILADIKQDTSFYTIDPLSTRRFQALSPVQFLTDLIYRRHPSENETQGLIHEHEDVIPIAAFFGEGRDSQAKVEYRRLLAIADVVFGIDLINSTQSIVFGNLSLEELVRTGQSNILGVVNVGLGQEARGLEKLTALVHDIKGLEVQKKGRNMSTTSSNEFQHLAHLIRGIKTAMLTTASADGSLRSRPMATLDAEFDGALWFFTRADAPKVGEVQQEEQVNVSYADADGQRFVSVSGRATLVLDREKIQELWNPVYKAWFPTGLDDPQIALLRVEAEQAEYWEAHSGAMGQLISLVKELVIRPNYLPGENQKVDLSETRGETEKLGIGI